MWNAPPVWATFPVAVTPARISTLLSSSAKMAPPLDTSPIDYYGESNNNGAIVGGN